MHAQNAMSLIELLVTLFLMTIVACISLPGLSYFFNDSQDKALQLQLLHAIEFARTEALIRHAFIGICKSENGKNCGDNWLKGQLVFIDEKSNGSILSEDQLLAVMQTHTSHGVLNWRAFPAYRDYLQFSPAGDLLNDNGTFWFCRKVNSAAMWAIILSKSGRARIAYPNQQGEIKDSAGRLLTC